MVWVMNLLRTSGVRVPGGGDANTEGAGRADQSRRAGEVDIISLVGQVPGIAIERQTRRQILDLETKVDQRTGSGLRRQRVVEALELLALVGCIDARFETPCVAERDRVAEASMPRSIGRGEIGRAHV